MTTGIINPGEDNVAAVWRGLAQALDSVTVRAPQIEPPELLRELDRIETEFVKKTAFSSELQIETKRRVAESKFKLISERNLPYGEVLPLYEQVCALGFSDLERDATIQIYFAQYCMRHSRSADAQGILNDLCSRLANAHAHDGLAVWEQLTRDAERILNQIRGNDDSGAARN